MHFSLVILTLIILIIITFKIKSKEVLHPVTKYEEKKILLVVK